MCGIFGIVINKNNHLNPQDIERTMGKLFILSESRGKEASGIAFRGTNKIIVAKYAESASSLIGNEIYYQVFEEIKSSINASRQSSDNDSLCLFGHSRLVTNGGQQNHVNNQPVITEGVVAIHNGIITNIESLWKKFAEFNKNSQNDTEIIPNLLRYYLESGNNLINSVINTYKQIEGAASIAVLFDDLNCLLLATNTGSLYIGKNNRNQNYLFASENYILSTLKKFSFVRKIFEDYKIEQVKAGNGLVINFENSHITQFSFLNDFNNIDINTFEQRRTKKKEIIDISSDKNNKNEKIGIPGQGPYFITKDFIDQYPKNRSVIDSLKRCTKCVLPETMPFIEFDTQGVCNYCRNYMPISPRGIDKLNEVLEPYKKNGNMNNCLITFSGGRDSSYGLHIVKTKLGMNPITYTYDWGMITDLGRRNQMRLCGKLGVENILVSANIARKRENIKLNVLAWLKKPDLGTVPLFMAGDKQYFYYANKVSKQTGCELIILCENLLETTRFKSGYCGIPPHHGSNHTYTLTPFDRVKLSYYYMKECISNPAYINKSVIDTMGAFFSYYLLPHNYLNIYQYVAWDEAEINRTLVSEYNWELAKDTSTTWRIGDGTASFYNYIYYTIGGLSEIDTFRSNQIREGMIGREAALELVKKENEPRYESIQWYCDVIGIDFYEAIKTINSAPKRY